MLVHGIALLIASSAPAQSAQDGPIATAARAESAEAQRVREALAYAAPLPAGAPREDYPLVAWCEALVTGHIMTGETLTSADALDRDIIRLGRLEAADFKTALAAAEPRATAAMKRAAEAAVVDVQGKWAPILSNPDEAARSQVFGLFYGLPGRCEHAARRIRSGVTSPPATLRDVGMDGEN